MSSLFRARVELRKLAEDWVFWSRAVAEAAEKVLGPCDVYVFGSILHGRLTGASDVDILIVSDGLPSDTRSRARLKGEIEEAAGLPTYHPFETHMATRREAEENPIYRRAILEGVLPKKASSR